MYLQLKPSSHPAVIDKQPRRDFSFSEDKVDPPPQIFDIDQDKFDPDIQGSLKKQEDTRWKKFNFTYNMIWIFRLFMIDYLRLLINCTIKIKNEGML